jgi:putative endonuclease
MYYAYVVKSIISDSYYKGHCADLVKRISEHNSGMTKSIKHLLPVKLIYFEEFNSLEEAIKREKHFKSAAGRRYLKTKIGLVV